MRISSFGQSSFCYHLGLSHSLPMQENRIPGFHVIISCIRDGRQAVGEHDACGGAALRRIRANNEYSFTRVIQNRSEERHQNDTPFRSRVFSAESNELVDPITTNLPKVSIR